MKLQGKRAVVTGGASGIGLAIAERLAEDGAGIVILDANGEKAAAAAADLAARGHRATSALVDVRDEAEIRRTIAAILRDGAIDVLVNSAGIGKIARFLDTSAELMDLMYQIHLRGSFLVGQAVAQSMVDRKVKGSIINIASVSGIRGNDERTAYGVAKAGVILMTKIMAVELSPLGIRTNAIAPGPIETPLAAATHNQAARQAWINKIPMGRYGDAKEVATAASFLASAEASYVNGHILEVDGGFAGSGILRT